MTDSRRSSPLRGISAAHGRARVAGAIYPGTRARAHDAVISLHVSTEWDHERFREYVIRHARNAQVADDQASLSAVTGIDTGLLGRYFRGQVQPGELNLEKIARAVPGTTMKDLRILSGRAKPEEYDLSEAPTVPLTAHRTAQRVDRLLGAKSPLNAEDQQLCDTMLNRVMDSFETQRVNGRRRTA